MKKIIHFLRKSSLFSRLFVAFLLMTVLPTIFLNALWFNEFKSSTLDLSSRLTTSATGIASTLVNKHFETYEQLSQTVYKNAEIINLIKDCNSLYLANNFMPEKQGLYEENKIRIGQLLNAYTSDNPYISNIQIVTPYDQFTRYDSYGLQQGGEIRSLETFIRSHYYEDTLAAKGYPLWFDTTSVHNIFYRNNNASYGIADTLTLTRAILNPYTNNVLGVLVINVHANFLHNLLLDFPSVAQSNLLIMSDQGIITSLFHNPGAPLIPHNTVFKEDWYSVDQGSFTQFVGNQYCFITYERLGQSPFFILNVMDYNLLIDQAFTTFTNIIAFSMIWVILSAVIAYVITLSVTGPINRLKTSMSQISLDSLNVSHPIHGNDEIGLLGQHFNKMIDNLNNLFNKVYVAELKEKELSFKHKNAQLNALQMQINPHFLYNTLDIIRWEAMYEANGESKVTHMIEDFSRLLRLGTKTSLDLIPIEEEISHTKAYLKVINYKFEDPITFTLKTSLDLKTYLMPKFLIQPLIENAVLHGFEGFEGKKEICITLQVQHEHLVFQIQNTGYPMAPELAQTLNQQLKHHEVSQKSIGLYNVNDRLQLYFLDTYILYFDCSDTTYTRIHLEFPICNPTSEGGVST